MSEAAEIRSIAVVGAGGVGGYFGARLARGLPGRQVSFLARGPHGEAIRREGLRLLTGSGEPLLCRPSRVTDDPAELPSPDLCLLCVKAYDLPGVLRRLSPRLRPQTVVLPLLNGVDIYDRVVAACPHAEVLPACAYLSVHVESAGVVRHVGQEGTILLGPDPRRPGTDAALVRGVLSQAGIRHSWNADPQPAIWQKYLFIAAFGMVTAVSGQSVGEVLADAGLAALVREVMAEILALAAASRVALPGDAAEQALAKARSFPPQTRTSYQRDVEAGRRTEGELFGGTILRLGSQLGIPVPATRRLHARLP